jgi:Cellulose biosynthesis protein BcsS
MRQVGRLLAGAAGVTLLFGLEPAVAQTKTSTAIFFGADAGPSANAFYVGTVVAMNGDFGRDGVLVRALGVYGTYDYDAAVGHVQGKYSLFDGMVGYQILRPGIRLAGYVGAEHQDHRLSPFDPNNPVVGGETGFKVAGDLTLGHGQPLFMILAGSFSTVFDTYWSRLRIGYTVNQISFGPEGWWSGKENSEEKRVGAFVGVRVAGTPIEITASGGYHFNDKGGIFGNRDGAYGSLNVGFSF